MADHSEVAYTTADGTTHYRLGDLIETAREYADKRVSP